MGGGDGRDWGECGGVDKLVVRGRGGGEEEQRKRGERGGKGDRVRQGERAIGRVNEISGHARVVRDMGGGGGGGGGRGGGRGGWGGGNNEIMVGIVGMET